MVKAPKPPIDLSPGQRVKWLRNRAHLTQAALGAAIGKDANTVAKLEAVKGVPRELDRVQDIADYFGIPLDWIIGNGTSIPTKSPTTWSDVEKFILTHPDLNEEQRHGILVVLRPYFLPKRK